VREREREREREEKKESERGKEGEEERERKRERERESIISLSFLSSKKRAIGRPRMVQRESGRGGER